jgi:serine/threonine protein phosphatase PrpC
MTLALRYAARSDRGLVRGNNQDSVYAGPRLLAVADGMGGHAAGDVASKVVIAALEHLDDDAPSGDMLQAMREAVFDGSEHLREVIRESPQLEGMGTTLTAVLFAGGRLALCHIGDSRAYLLRDGVLSQITHDDTFVQTLIDDGRITPEEANHHPQRSLLLRALNGQEVDPYLSMREARAGDRYLLCSDGLSGVVSEETLAAALEDPDPQATADRLIELALRSGGPDNITVIVADVVEDGGHGTAPVDPVVDGAAGDNIGQREVDPRSAAGRAALHDPPPVSPTSSGAGASMVAAPPPGRRGRRLLWGLGALLLVAAVAVGAYLWLLSNWFVGVEDTSAGERVTVFRGIDTAVLGVDLNRVADVTDLAVGDLTQADASKVRRGIDATDGDHADRIVAMLRAQRLPVCPSEDAVSGQTLPTPTPTPTPTPAPDGVPAPGGLVPPSVPAETTSEATAAERSTPAPEPGVDCREAK